VKSSKRKIEDWKRQVYGPTEELDNKYGNLTGRELGIMAGAILDNGLAHAIENKLRNDPKELESFLGLNDDGRAPLGTFGARIQLAYLLGIINKKEMDSLRTFKKIRNLFAHKVNINFGSEEVLREMPKMVDDYFDIPFGTKTKNDAKAVEVKKNLNTVTAEAIFRNVFIVRVIVMDSRVSQTDRMEIQRDRKTIYDLARGL
jgi:DNA-binding MltR family transcriptional regulator